MITVGAVVKSLSCNEMQSAGFSAHSSLLYHHLWYDDLVFGDARLLGDALHLGEAPVSDGDGLVFDDVPIPRSDVSEVSVHTSRVVRAISSEPSRVLCCWSLGDWVGCS